MTQRILIVDDAENMREMLRLTLDFEGYETELACNGVEALEIARQSEFNLILCDIEMPEMDGLQFVKRYRNEFGGDTPIVMLTAEDNEITLDRSLEAGATSVLIKPFEPIRMLDEVRDRIENRV